MELVKNKIICNHYGITNQVKKAIEEMAELTLEIVRENFNDLNLKCEIADVYNCLGNLCVIYDIDFDEILRISEEKKDREITRILKSEV